jgi:hypothetical protein
MNTTTSRTRKPRPIPLTYIARLACRDGANHPVTILPESDQSPRRIGEGFYFTTPSGKTIINHPSAYHWPKSYHGSTLAIEVGHGWLDAWGPYTRHTSAGVQMIVASGQQTIVHGMRVTPGWATAQWDRGRALYLVEGDGWSYHADRSPAITSRHAVRAALKNRHQQRLMDRQHARDAETLGRVWVERQDSIAAGNCPLGTDTYANHLLSAIGAAGECAVRADVLLTHRNDRYTRRTVAYASQRLGQKLEMTI